MPKKYVIGIVLFGAFALAGLIVSIYDLVYVMTNFDVVEGFAAYVWSALSWLFLSASIFAIFLEKRRLEWILIILACVSGVIAIIIRIISLIS